MATAAVNGNANSYVDMGIVEKYVDVDMVSEPGKQYQNRIKELNSIAEGTTAADSGDTSSAHHLMSEGIVGSYTPSHTVRMEPATIKHWLNVWGTPPLRMTRPRRKAAKAGLIVHFINLPPVSAVLFVNLTTREGPQPKGRQRRGSNFCGSLRDRLVNTDGAVIIMTLATTTPMMEVFNVTQFVIISIMERLIAKAAHCAVCVALRAANMFMTIIPRAADHLIVRIVFMRMEPRPEPMGIQRREKGETIALVSHLTRAAARTIITAASTAGATPWVDEPVTSMIGNTAIENPATNPVMLQEAIIIEGGITVRIPASNGFNVMRTMFNAAYMTYMTRYFMVNRKDMSKGPNKPNGMVKGSPTPVEAATWPARPGQPPGTSSSSNSESRGCSPHADRPREEQLLHLADHLPPHRGPIWKARE